MRQEDGQKLVEFLERYNAEYYARNIIMTPEDQEALQQDSRTGQLRRTVDLADRHDHLVFPGNTPEVRRLPGDFADLPQHATVCVHQD